MSTVECPFCNLKPTRVWAENAVAVAFYDGFPVSEGHTLIIPRAHVGSLYQLTETDQQWVWSLVAEVRESLHRKYDTTDCNIGLNDGPLAGQTVGHAHVHVIPRRKGDVDDPRGGIRWVIPEKAKYWA